MKYVVIVFLFVGASIQTLAQEDKSEKTDYTTPLYVQRTSSIDSSVAPIRISEPLFLVQYNSVTEEVTKPQFEDLTQQATKNVESITVLKESKALAPYGSKGRNGVVILALKGKPAYSEKFLNQMRNSGTN